MCVVFGGLLPVLGTTSIYITWPWPLFCLGIASAVVMLAQYVKQGADEGDLDGPHWLRIVASAYLLVAGSWCLVTLFFWEPRNAANHCFLVAIAIAASALFLTSRSGLFVLVMCAMLPNLGMIWLHLLRGEMYPLMFHQANLWRFQENRTLLTDLLDRVLTRFEAISRLPVLSVEQTRLGQLLMERLGYWRAGVSGTWWPDGRVTITARRGAVVPVTGVCEERCEIYGPFRVASVALAEGEVRQLRVAPRQ